MAIQCYTSLKAISSNASARLLVSRLYSVRTLEAVDIVAGYIHRITAYAGLPAVIRTHY